MNLIFGIIFGNQVLHENVASLLGALFERVFDDELSPFAIVHVETLAEPLGDLRNFDLSSLADFAFV